MQKIKKVPDLTILNSPEETDYFVGYDVDQADPDKATVLIPVAKGRNIIVDSITALEALTGTVDGQVVKVKGYYAGVPLDMPDYVVDISSTDTPNGGSIIARAEGGNYIWKEVLTVSPMQFGAKGDDDGTGLVGQNDTPFIQNALSFGLPIDFGTYKYAVNTATSELLFTNSIYGDGAVITNNDATKFTFKYSYTGTTDKNLYYLKFSGILLNAKYGLTYNEERVNIDDGGVGGAPLKGLTIEESFFNGVYDSGDDPNYNTDTEVPLDGDGLPAELEGYGIGLKLSKCFGAKITSCLFQKTGIGVALYGSDINNIDTCRFEDNARHVNEYRTNTFGSQNKIRNCDILRTRRVGGISTSGNFTTIDDNYFENTLGAQEAARFMEIQGRNARINKNRFDSPGADGSTTYPAAMYFGDEASATLEGNVWNYSGFTNIFFFTDNFKATTSQWFPAGGFSRNNLVILGDNYFVKGVHPHPRLIKGADSHFMQGNLRNEREINLNVYCSFTASLGNQYEEILVIPYSSMTGDVGENDVLSTITGTVYQNIINAVDGSGTLYVTGATEVPSAGNVEVDGSNYVVATDQSYFRWMMCIDSQAFVWEFNNEYLRPGKNYRIEIVPLVQIADVTLVLSLGNQTDTIKYFQRTITAQSTNNQDTYIFSAPTNRGLESSERIRVTLSGASSKMLIRDIRIVSDDYYVQDITWDVPSLASGGSTSTARTVLGIEDDDEMIVSYVGDSQGIMFYATRTGVNAVSIYAYNPTVGTIDLPSSTLKLKVKKP